MPCWLDVGAGSTCFAGEPDAPPACLACRQAKERAAVEGGKRPFYLKKSEQRRLELLAKYEELQVSSGRWCVVVWWCAGEERAAGLVRGLAG